MIASQKGAITVATITADFFLEHETSYTQHKEFWVWECSCGAIEEEKFVSWDECHMATRRHWAEKLNESLNPAALHKEGAGGALVELGQELSDSIGLYALAIASRADGDSANDGEIGIAIKRCVAAKRAWDAAATDAPKETPQDDNLRRHNEAYQRRLRKEASDVE